MYKLLLTILVIILLLGCRRHTQVTTATFAYDKIYEAIRTDFRQKHRIDIQREFTLFIRAFKMEEELEIWVKPKRKDTYHLLKTYDFCKSSGKLGPKRMEGDLQIPEGFYHIDRFNPKSSYHLSLGINYPNASDKILSNKEMPGSDIFIHGACVTIGCIPITDELIEEVYVIASEAKNFGQERIPVHIFPARLTEKNVSQLHQQYPKHQAFWANLQKGYAHFEDLKQLPQINVDDKGQYLFE